MLTPQEIVAKAIENRDTCKTVVIYHANCSDGFGAAWAAHCALGNRAEYFPAIHGKADPLTLHGDYCFIVDFSFPLATLLEMERNFKHVVVLDHHKTAKDILAEFGCAVFDNDRSGAGITWDTFHPNKPRPKLIDYVEDRDLWRKALPDTDIVSCMTEQVPQTMEDWTEYSCRLEDHDGFKSIIQQGMAVLAYKKQLIDHLAEDPRMIRFAGYDVPIVNCITAFKSDLGNVLAKVFPFAILWSQSSDGRFVYSLRSAANGPDVAEIASTMGGGGHRSASGFSADHLIG